jgi:hypothetical protein
LSLWFKLLRDRNQTKKRVGEQSYICTIGGIRST